MARSILPALRRITLACAALTGLAFGAAAPAAALSVSGAYNAEITSVDPALASLFSIGDTVTFHFTYVDTPNTGDATNGEYLNHAIGWITFGTNLTTSKDGPGSSVQVQNDAPGDRLGIFYPLGGDQLGPIPTAGSYVPYRAGVSLFGAASLFPSSALPAGYIPAAQLNSGTFGMTFLGNAGLVAVSGKIIGVTQTPIPAGLPLFATALAGLGVIGWRRRRAH